METVVSLIYYFGQVLLPFLLPLLVIALFLNWKSKRRLEDIRKNYSAEKLERYNRKGRKK